MDPEIRDKYLDTFDRSGSRIITFEDYVMGLSQILRSVKEDTACAPTRLRLTRWRVAGDLQDGPAECRRRGMKSTITLHCRLTLLVFFLLPRGVQFGMLRNAFACAVAGRGTNPFLSISKREGRYLATANPISPQFDLRTET